MAWPACATDCVGNAKRLTNGVRINRGTASIIMALAAATASLDDVDQVQNGRHLNSEKRAFVHRPDRCDGLQTDPVAGELHHDRHKTPGRVIQALKQRNVHVGRLFPAFPNYMRVTIGKNVEMETFSQPLGKRWLSPKPRPPREGISKHPRHFLNFILLQSPVCLRLSR
jgi:hypothetical protein